MAWSSAITILIFCTSKSAIGNPLDAEGLRWVGAQNSELPNKPLRMCSSPAWSLFSYAIVRVEAAVSGASLGAVVTVDEELSQLDDNLRRLKIEFDVYFGGGAKKPPTELEWRVQSTLKKFSDGRRMSYGQRFKFNTIQQKFAIYNSLWQQKLRIKEEGYRRPQDALLAIQGVRDFEGQHEVTDADALAFQIADAEAEKSTIKALYEAMLGASKANKTKAPAGSFESFQQFVKKKTEQLRHEYGSKTVEFAVEVEDGKVRLKAKAK